MSEGSDDFEVIVAVPEEREVRVGLPREKLEALVELLDALKWDKRSLKRYVNAALRLRKLERERGKSYLALLKEYEKMSKEEVKLQYSISQLKEKREKIEEDLKLYLDQHRLTLELVSRVAPLVSAMRERGLDVEDLERSLNVLENLKALGYDAGRLVEELGRFRSLLKEVEAAREEVERVRSELERLREERRRAEEELAEVYGVRGGLAELRAELEGLKAERERLKEEISRLVEEAEALRKEIERLTGTKASIEEAEAKLEEMREELGRLGEEEGRLKREIGELVGVRGDVEDIKKKVEEMRGELERLEKLVEERRAYAEVLEGEMAASYTILKLFTDPQGAEAEDLESLAQQLQTLARVKRGEAPVLRPLEPHLLERARQSIISLIMPYIKRELVPRKAFERIENELRRLNEKRLALEEEIASLRRALELKHRIEVVHRSAEKETGLVMAVTPEGEAVELKDLEHGRRVKVTCPYCRASAITRIPSEEGLEELSSKRCKLRFTCESCGKYFEVGADAVLRRLRG